MRKKLTYIVNYLSDDDAQHYVHIPGLLDHLETLGWEIDLVSERGGRGTAEVLGRRVTFLSKNSKIARIANLMRHLLNMRWSGGRLVFVRISKFAAFQSAILGRLFGWKTVYWLSDVKEDFNARRKWSRARFFAMKLLMETIHRLATGPEWMVDYYRRAYDIPATKIILLYNDINLANISKAHGPDSCDAAHILLVHRLSPAREVARYFPRLLHAASRYARQSSKAVCLDVCGDGPELAQLKDMAMKIERNVNVRFHGAVPQRALASFYDRATIFVMPSYREGFPRVMIEAMARGLPIVATNAGGTADLCGPAQRAFIVNRDDCVAFGDAVERLLSSTNDQKELRQENLAKVRQYDTKNVAQMYDRALSALIGVSPAQ